VRFLPCRPILWRLGILLLDLIDEKTLEVSISLIDLQHLKEHRRLHIRQPESCGKAIESILRGHAGRPLRRTWIDRPYGEEEISRLEEEALPAIQQCLARVHEIDSALEVEAQLGYRQQVKAEALLRRGDQQGRELGAIC
jgi:hypothetical protein